MKLAAISTLFALSAVGTCSALAPRQAPASAASFYFEGPFVSTGNYANFTQCVPEDGHTYSITQPMVIYSIIPDDTLSKCTFFGATGSVTVVSGSQQDVVPEQYVAVFCAARSGPVVTPVGFPNFTEYFPTISTACPVATGAS